MLGTHIVVGALSEVSKLTFGQIYVQFSADTELDELVLLLLRGKLGSQKSGILEERLQKKIYKVIISRMTNFAPLNNILLAIFKFPSVVIHQRFE